MGGLKESIVRNMQNIYKAEKIYICVDNPDYEKELKDGSKPAQNFIDKIEKEFSFKTIIPKSCKDWNELLNKDNKMLEIIKWRPRNTKKYKKILFIVGILICLTSAGLMFDGAIFGETTKNLATVLGITGICLITTQKRAMNRGGE